MTISRQQELEWHRRIAGGSPLVSSQDLHAELDAAVTRYSGAKGLAELSGNAPAVSTDSRGFAGLRVRSKVGDVTLTRTLTTPWKTSPGAGTGGAHPGEATLLRSGSVQINVQYSGTSSIWAENSKWKFPAGTANYVRSGFPHTTVHAGLSDILTVTIPLSRLSDLVDHFRADPVRQFADNDISLGMAAFAGMFLFRRLVGPPDEQADEADQEAAIVSVARSALVPLLRAQDMPPSPTMERLIAHEIELRHRDPNLDVDGLAQIVGLSRRQLYRYTNEGLAEGLGRRRAQTARELMTANPELELSQVARAAGFSDANRLRHHFTKAFGELPSAYRERVSQEIRD